MRLPNFHPREFRWRYRPRASAPSGKPMTTRRRKAVYFATNNSPRLTPRQGRRVTHKENAGRA